jgi:exonuclease III
MTKIKNDENTDILQNTRQNLRLKIFSWNINGIDNENKKKFSKLTSFLHQNYGIHMIQEIHLPNDITTDKMQSKNCRFFLNGS